MPLARLALLVPFLSVLLAQTAIDPRGVTGVRLLAGGGRLPAGIYDYFLQRAGGEQARVVLIPTASMTVDDEEGRAKNLQRWRDAHPGVHFELLHTRDRAVADSEAFTAPLRAATGVWIGGGAQARLAEAYLGTRVERELYALLDRGGIVGGSSAGTAIQTRVMIERGMDPPTMATGFDLLPLAISDQHFLARERMPRLVRALALRPGRFGVGIDEGTAIVVEGRDVRVIGRSKAVFVLPAVGEQPQRVQELRADERTDLITWQRAAVQRQDARWPPQQPGAPRVAKGSLLLAGGGELPAAIWRRFVELAGGADAKILFVPAATPKDARRAQRSERVMQRLRELGAGEVTLLDHDHPSDVTDEVVAQIDAATGVWFTGGRQWRIVDTYGGTDAVAAFHRVLQRGGVIAGSSAGATIQGELLVRGNPLTNQDMWCRGYDRGFAFLPGCAVDQHFVARDRTEDLRALIAEAPQFVGLGVDERTAALVQGDTLTVLGASKVAVFDARRTPDDVQPAWLEPGQRWDLTAGEPVR